MLVYKGDKLELPHKVIMINLSDIFGTMSGGMFSVNMAFRTKTKFPIVSFPSSEAHALIYGVDL